MTGSTFGRSISNCSCFRLFRNLPPHCGQHGNSATFVSFTSFRLGLARCTKRPCPALRPGRFGCSTHCLHANGVACRFSACSNSFTRIFKSVHSSTRRRQQSFSPFFSQALTLYKIMFSHGKQVLTTIWLTKG